MNKLETKFSNQILNNTSAFSDFRKSFIGCIKFWRSIVLPENHCWANGDFIEFADWPELHEVYLNGGFEGVLMAWDADSGTQAANLGQWRPDAEEPTGLYTPVLTGQFMRCWENVETTSAGASYKDTMRVITGRAYGYSHSSATHYGAFSFELQGPAIQGGNAANHGYFVFNSANLGESYSGTETAPVHVYMPHIIYLGNPA